MHIPKIETRNIINIYSQKITHVTRTICVKSFNESIQHGYRICHRIVSYKQSIQYGYRICCTSSNGIFIMYQLSSSNVYLDLTITSQLTHLTCYCCHFCHNFWSSQRITSTSFSNIDIHKHWKIHNCRYI